MQNLNASGFTHWRRYDPEWLYILPNQLMPLMGDIDPDWMQQGFGANPGKLVYITHHNAHMGWAFASPFEEAAIAVLDEYGEASSISYGVLQGNSIKRIGEVQFPHSLGVFYATFTQFLGFEPNSEEWKVMGAAAYGTADTFAPAIRQLIRVRDGELTLDQTYFEFANTRFGGYYRAALISHLGIEPRRPGEAMRQVYFDLAAAVQAVYEDALFELLKWLAAKTRMRNLVINGGCAMNSLANGKIAKCTPFEQVFVSQAPADNGCAIGGALWLHGRCYAPAQSIWRTKVPACCGPAWSDLEIADVLNRCKLRYHKSDDIAAEAARLIASNHVVGWFQGAMEFGERALGARSILADPRDARMKDRINATIKFREEFRPFAPSVLAEAAHEYFDIPHGASSDYMEAVFPVRPEKRSVIPAVVHADGTGRLQTVHKESSALFWRLIDSFRQQTGIPVVLNTSYNVSGEPIVCSPVDALRTFIASGLDALAIGCYIVAKTPIETAAEPRGNNIRIPAAF
jgi:carbamoyltransferase